MTNKLWEILVSHFGKIFGTIIGLLLGWIIIRYGVIRGIFVSLCVILGFYLGDRYDSKGDVSDIVDRFLG